jgi:hypothetical protein
VAKLPRYMELTPVGGTKYKPSLSYNLTIKKWGWPFVLLKVLKGSDYPWYKWLFYPWLCVKVMRKGVDE